MSEAKRVCAVTNMYTDPRFDRCPFIDWWGWKKCKKIIKKLNKI